MPSSDIIYEKPIVKVEETLRDINRKLDKMILEMQYIKSDTKLIKEKIQEKEKVEKVGSGWWIY